MSLCTLSWANFMSELFSMEIPSFITALSQCPSKNPLISRFSREIFIHTCISIILSKCLLRWSVFFAQASKLRSDKNRHLKTLYAAVFYLHINALSNVVCVSWSGSNSQGITPHKKSIFFWEGNWGWLVRSLLKFQN